MSIHELNQNKPYVFLDDDTVDTSRDDVLYFNAKPAKPFQHDYRPRLEPIRAEFIQDIPGDLIDRHRGAPLPRRYKVCDPYLPCADVMNNIIRNGKLFMGFMVKVGYIPATFDNRRRRYTAKNPPPLQKWGGMMADLAYWSPGRILKNAPEIHPLAFWHLHLVNAYIERHIAYFEALGEDPVRLNNILDAGGAAVGADLMMDRPAFQELWEKVHGDPRFVREYLFPPGTVTFPDNARIGIESLERAIKDVCERLMAEGAIAITGIQVLACERGGGYIMTGSGTQMTPFARLCSARDSLYIHLTDACYLLVEDFFHAKTREERAKAWDYIDQMMYKSYNFPYHMWLGLPAFQDDLEKNGEDYARGVANDQITYIASSLDIHGNRDLSWVHKGARKVDPYYPRSPSKPLEASAVDTGEFEAFMRKHGLWEKARPLLEKGLLW